MQLSQNKVILGTVLARYPQLDYYLFPVLNHLKLLILWLMNLAHLQKSKGKEFRMILLLREWGDLKVGMCALCIEREINF